MGFTLILRHADREHIKDDLSNVFTANLLLEGMLRSKRMGASICEQLGSVNRVYTSIAPRCYSTGILIARYCSIPLRPQVIREASKYGDFSGGYLKEGMMDPWLSVVSGDRASGRPYSHLMRKWVESGLARLDRDGYAEHILPRYLSAQNIVAITHDTNVSPLAEYFSEKYGFAFTQEMYHPPYLTGLCLLHNAGVLNAIRWVRPPPVLSETQELPLIETLWERKSD